MLIVELIVLLAFGRYILQRSQPFDYVGADENDIPVHGARRSLIDYRTLKRTLNISSDRNAKATSVADSPAFERALNAKFRPQRSTTLLW